MSEIILHHYEFSNYSEKVRVALGYKGLAWKSVIVPPVLPKPDLVALTGGYRRAPVLQIGADIYCDTRLIIREIDHRFPEPTLYPACTLGVANAISLWAETTFFRSAILLAWGTNHDLMPEALSEDRAAMRGLPTPSLKSVEKAAARSAPLVRAQLPYIENMLADGRQWICGNAFSAADLSVFHTIWFLTDRSERLAPELLEFHAINAWMARMRDVGHGSRVELAPWQAIAIARQASPLEPREGRCHSEDPAIGSIVEARANDYARDTIVGTLDFLDQDEFAIRLNGPAVGEVSVHFPRIGYELRPSRVA